MKCILAGGGTGGHIYAGVAIAQEFLSQSKSNEVLFVGSTSGLEGKLVPKAGYNLKKINLGKLVGQGLFRKLLTLFQIPIAVFHCIRIIKEFKPDFVVGVGGYAAGPCMIAAKLCGLPIGVLEQNAVMGFTNKLSSKLANYVFTAFDEVPEGVPTSKCIYTGCPARSELKPITNPTDDPFTIFVFGGSQGAAGINKLMPEVAKILKEKNIQVQIIHQTGDRDFESVKSKYSEFGSNADVHKFIYDMQNKYNKASLVICRAGAGTITELGVTQSAAILIPFPQAAQNHQEHNARMIEKANAGKCFLQSQNGTEASPADLAKLIIDLKNDSSLRSTYRKNITQFFKADASKRIVDIMKTDVLKRHPNA